MKPKASPLKHLAAIGASIFTLSSASAQLQWDANNTGGGQTDGAGTWLNANQWWDGGSNVTWNNGTPDSASIGNGGAGATITVGNVTAGTVSFSNFSGTYTLDGTAGSTTITQSGGVTVGPTAGNVTFRTTGIAGAGGVTMNNSGRLVLGSNPVPVHTYSGDTNLNNGVTMFSNNYSANSNINMNGGVLEGYWSNAITQTLGSGANQIRITGGESGFSLNGNTGLNVNLGGGAITWGSTNFAPTKFVLQSQYSQSNSNITFQNALNLNGATRTVLVNSGTTGNARALISGAISNSTGTAGFIKEGAGRLQLTNNASAWNGDTTVSAGILDMGGINIANIGGGSGRNISVATGASVRFNDLTNAILNRFVETTNEIGVMTGGSSNLDFSSSTGADLPNAFLGNWAGNGAKRDYSGTITPGSDGYKLGALGSSGALGIVGSDKLTGSNTLTVGQTGASGIRVVVADDNDFTGNTIINSGAKLTLGDNLAIQNSALDVGAAGGNIAFNKAGNVSGVSITASPTLGGLIGSRNLISVFTTSGGNNESNHTAAEMTGFSLNVGTGKTHSYSGAIGGFGTGAVGVNGGNSTLTKTGAGTQILSGVSTYTGATNINQGTLQIDGAGSINGSAVTLNGGAFVYNSSVAYSGSFTFTNGTLGGTNLTGNLGGQTIGAGQTLSPGNSPGTAVTTNQTWAGGGDYLWEVNDAEGTAGADPGWDLINGSGTLNITATSGDPFNILVTSLTLGNAAGLAANFDELTDYEWLLADFASITGFTADAFNIDTSAFSNPFTGTFGISLGGDGAVPGDNSQIYLTYAAAPLAIIPEPSTALLSALSLLALLRRKR